MKKETILFTLSLVMLVAALYFFVQTKYPAALPEVGQQTDNSSNTQDASSVNDADQPADSSDAGTSVSKDKILDLSNNNLEKIPSYVFNMTELEKLDVSHNALTGAIQSQIGQLRNLKVLDASNNQMTGVPAEVGQLSKLEVLDLSNNQLTGLPDELGNLKNLKTMNLSGNAYSEQDLAGIRQKLPGTNFILN